MEKCKHEWRQVIEMWSGITPSEKIRFYCINCLKIKEKELDRAI